MISHCPWSQILPRDIVGSQDSIAPFWSLKRRDFEASDSRSIGTGGIEKFTFVPIKTGETEIIMIYKRPWESKSADEKSFRLIIND